LFSPKFTPKNPFIPHRRAGKNPFFKSKHRAPPNKVELHFHFIKQLPRPNKPELHFRFVARGRQA